MSTHPSPASPKDDHVVQITISQDQKAVPTDHLNNKDLSTMKNHAAIPYEKTVSIDQLLSRYPEALQSRATWPCPLCKTEIPVPNGNLQAYAKHLKETNADIRAGAPVVLRIRAGCRLTHT